MLFTFSSLLQTLHFSYFSPGVLGERATDPLLPVFGGDVMSLFISRSLGSIFVCLDLFLQVWVSLTYYDGGAHVTFELFQ